jgi:hypothetical protein
MRTIAKLGVVVMLLSFAALAANNGPVKLTASGKAGGTPYKQVAVAGATGPLFSNLATDNKKGLYYCCAGWELTGPNWLYSQFGYQWIGIQFTLAQARTAKKITTSVSYEEPGTYTDFLISIQADANGVPSGTPLGTGPWTVTMDSQTSGQCCSVEIETIKHGLPLAAGTYWVVWSTEAGSDLFSIINYQVLDQVDASTVAYYAGVEGEWFSYQTVEAPAVEVQ